MAITGGPRRNIGNWPLKLKGYGYAVRSDLGLAMIVVAALGPWSGRAAQPARCTAWRLYG